MSDTTNLRPMIHLYNTPYESVGFTLDNFVFDEEDECLLHFDCIFEDPTKNIHLLDDSDFIEHLQNLVINALDHMTESLKQTTIEEVF